MKRYGITGKRWQMTNGHILDITYWNEQALQQFNTCSDFTLLNIDIAVMMLLVHGAVPCRIWNFVVLLTLKKNLHPPTIATVYAIILWKSSRCICAYFFRISNNHIIIHLLSFASFMTPYKVPYSLAIQSILSYAYRCSWFIVQRVHLSISIHCHTLNVSH